LITRVGVAAAVALCLMLLAWLQDGPEPVAPPATWRAYAPAVLRARAAADTKAPGAATTIVPTGTPAIVGTPTAAIAPSATLAVTRTATTASPDTATAAIGRTATLTMTPPSATAAPNTTPTPESSWTPTPTPGTSHAVRIGYLHCTTSDEYVRIRNEGGSSVDLADWSIISVVGRQTYTFSTYVLETGSDVYVHSGPDAPPSGGNRLRWTSAYVWNNDDDTAQLEDPDGEVVAEEDC